jgi:hypothetical protein
MRILHFLRRVSFGTGHTAAQCPMLSEVEGPSTQKGKGKIPTGWKGAKEDHHLVEKEIPPNEKVITPSADKVEQPSVKKSPAPLKEAPIPQDKQQPLANIRIYAESHTIVRTGEANKSSRS